MSELSRAEAGGTFAGQLAGPQDSDPTGALAEAKTAGATRPELPIRFRDFAEGDKSMILSNWLRSNRPSEQFKTVPSEFYYRDHQLTIGEIAQNSPIRVCCSIDDPNVVYGWICSRAMPEGLLVHYIYVKQMFRLLGIGDRLMRDAGWTPGTPVIASHWNKKIELVKEKYGAVHRPRMMYRNK